MRLRQVVFSFLSAVLLGLITREFSFDFENYVRYADHIEAASIRFYAEPIFPLFLLALSYFELPSDQVIQLFMTLGAFFTVYSLVSLSNNKGEWGVLRSAAALTCSIPFIIFSLSAPRQGLAVGLILLATVQVTNSSRFTEWKTIALLFLAAMSHAATGFFCTLIIFIGYSNLKRMRAPLIFLVSIILLGIELSQTEAFRSLTFSYNLYVGNMRETGVWRLALFVVIASVYLMFSSPRVGGGFFATTAPRNYVVALTASLTCVALYFLVATDAIRLTYVPAMVMIAERFRKIEFPLRSRLSGRQVGGRRT